MLVPHYHTILLHLKKSPSEYELPNITEYFVLDPVTENEIMKIISNFKDSSAVMK